MFLETRVPALGACGRELLQDDRFDTRVDTTMELFDCVEVFYNQAVPALDARPVGPAAFERRRLTQRNYVVREIG